MHSVGGTYIDTTATDNACPFWFRITVYHTQSLGGAVVYTNTALIASFAHDMIAIDRIEYFIIQKNAQSYQGSGPENKWQPGVHIAGKLLARSMLICAGDLAHIQGIEKFPHFPGA